MSIAAATTVYVEGFEGRYTSYALEVRDPRVDFEDETVTIDVYTGKRDGNSAIVEEADYVLSAGGQEIARKEGAEWNARSSEVDEAVSLTGEIDTNTSEASLSLDVTLPEWDASETVDFDVEIPDQVSEDDLSVDCSADPSQVTVGERVTVTATVSNDADTEADVEIVIELAGATDETTEVVSGGESVEREAAFEMEEAGEYEPRVNAELT